MHDNRSCVPASNAYVRPLVPCGVLQETIGALHQVLLVSNLLVVGLFLGLGLYLRLLLRADIALAARIPFGLGHVAMAATVAFPAVTFTMRVASVSLAVRMATVAFPAVALAVRVSAVAFMAVMVASVSLAMRVARIALSVGVMARIAFGAMGMMPAVALAMMMAGIAFSVGMAAVAFMAMAFTAVTFSVRMPAVALGTVMVAGVALGTMPFRMAAKAVHGIRHVHVNVLDRSAIGRRRHRGACRRAVWRHRRLEVRIGRLRREGTRCLEHTVLLSIDYI